MTPAAGIGRSVFAPGAFFGGAEALRCRSAGLFAAGTAFATIGSYAAVVDFTHAAVRFAAVTAPAKQLNVRCFVAASA